MKCRLTVILLGIAIACVGTACAECNGRGRKVSGKCVCDNTRPAQGLKGSTGTECEIDWFIADVYRADLNGNDFTASCASHDCNKLQYRHYVCFYAGLDWNSTSDPWNYLTVQLNRTSAYGDPDLFGMFDAVGNKGKKPSNISYNYQFSETSSSIHPTVVKRVPKKSFHHQYDGVYLCVRAYGGHNITFNIRAVLSECPSDFSDDGEEMICSTPKSSAHKRHSGCKPDGTCACVEPYKKPMAATYEGLGFDDCSAKITEISDADFGSSKSYKLSHAPGNRGFDYYSFHVRPDDYQVVARFSGEDGPYGRCSAISRDAYFKYGQPPGWRYGQYDVRPVYDYGANRKDLELVFDRKTRNYHTGLWYLGIDGNDERPCNYTLTINKYECPLNCTNRGQCVHSSNGTNYCDCDSGYFGETCSFSASALSYGQSVSKLETSFQYEYFELPSFASHSSMAEVRFACSFHSRYYSAWTTSRPELLLLKGDDDSYPTEANATYRVTLDEQNTTYNIDLCPSQLKQGVWRAAIYNPRHEYKLGYSLEVTKHGMCLNSCSGHGRCTEDGSCICDDSWSGGDCSVDTSGQQCLEGSRRPVARPDEAGKCWQECKCSGNHCTFQQACSDFTCDSANQRRKGSEDRCITDACKQDTWEENERHSCLKKCVCPSDGSACQLDSQCDSHNFSCKHGHKRFSNGAPKCYPVGCEAGSLAASSAKVTNGVAYGTCQCGSEETEDRPHCRVEENDVQALSVVCNGGFSLKDAKRHADSHRFLGGRCVPSQPGTPAWGVVLFVLFSMLIGGCVSMAGLWYYEHKVRYRPSETSYYQELSTS